jgi:hypothetical protein
MSVTDVERVPWKPLTEEDREAVRASLREVLNSSPFSSSKRYPALLEYLVEQTLEGRDDHIKERTIGVVVFGRPADYDTNTDTAVRYSAGEVRKRLALYYHAHANAPIQIVLSNRSYVPEFLRLEATEHRDAPSAPCSIEDRAVVGLIAELRTVDRWRRTALGAIALLALVLITFGFIWARGLLHPDPLVEFWGSVLETKQTSLICPGGVVFASDSLSGTRVADQSVPDPFLSFGSSLAVGRAAVALNAHGGQYRIQSAASTTLAQITDNPVVLIGAYNNAWTQRFLRPLRFHFQQQPLEQIVDTANPGRVWKRDASKPFNEGTDYAIVARFRETSTANTIVVLAGLQRFGTDAASQFVVNPGLLKELNRRAGSDWRHKNIEVVLKVDVVAGRTGAPQIEDVTFF